MWQALPAAASATASLTPFNAAFVDDGGVEYFIARTGYTGEDGFEIALPATAARRAVASARRARASGPAGSARATRCASKPG